MFPHNLLSIQKHLEGRQGRSINQPTIESVGQKTRRLHEIDGIISLTDNRT